MRRFLFLVSLFFGTGIIVHAQMFNEQGLKLMKLYSLIDAHYFDTVNLNQISEDAIVETLKKLDPHSKYIPAKDAQQTTEQIEGNFDGIGVSFNIFNDTVMVVSVIAGGPSEKVGIQQGDRIVRVDTENIAGIKITTKQVMQKLRGKKGTLVHVGIIRRGVNKELTFSIVRDKIPIYSIDASYQIDKTTGYIKLSRFAATTKDELTKALTQLKKNKVQDIILDLTGNGGGLLDMAVNLADEFLDSGKVVVYTKGLHAGQSSYISTTKGLFEKGRLVIMIDENSASASEIFAGAIQDWDRGIIVGRRSFGKGLVQNQFRFSDGSLVRLTVARYYTPTGRLIQKPYTDDLSAYSKDLINRYKHGEFTNKDSIHFPDSLKYFTLVKHRMVFGGGGIMPDVFVPLDTLFYSDYSRSLIGKGSFNKFILNYLDKNRKTLSNQYSSFKKYKQKFQVTEQILNELTHYAEEQGVKFDSLGFTKSKSYLTTLLKASLARDIWGSSEFYEIYNTLNPIFIEATQSIKQDLPALKND
jgi:carboxyl-terminal processing protease